MGDADLLRRVCQTAHGFLQVGNEVFGAEGATFVRNRDFPRRYDANHVVDVLCATVAEINSLMARVEQEFEGCRHRRFDLDPLTPPQIEARLVLDSYQPSDVLQMVLRDELRIQPRPIAIRLVRTEEEWTALIELMKLEWTETLAGTGKTYDAETQRQFVLAKRRQSPAIQHWLGFLDQVPCGFISSWPGYNRVGIVEDVFTRRECRHRGVATAMITHGVAQVRASGAGPVIIGPRAYDTPKQMYAAMGFEPFVVTRQFLRVTE
ncbi:MAG TPA: GNAT family N-acetyltransferase [Candidatus Acidoferrales bacterium]|nr:GNAT family N-acetyltransferase [Candidatus Acidoferrales bacterium]